MSLNRAGQSADLSGTAALRIGQEAMLQAFWVNDEGERFSEWRTVKAKEPGRYPITLYPTKLGVDLLVAESIVILVDVLAGTEEV